MSNIPNAKPPASPAAPDFLAPPGKGKGVRRLNRVPLFVVAAVVLLAAGAITYSYFAKQAPGAAQSASKQLPPVAATAVPPVGPDGADFIAGPGPASTPAPAQAASEAPQPAQLQPTAAPAPAPSAQYQNRMRLIERMEEKKLATLEAALAADGAVQTFKRRQPGDRQQDGAQATPDDGTADTFGDQKAREMQKYLAAAGMQPPGAGAGADSGLPGMGMMNTGGSSGGGGDSGMAAENRQDKKQAFLSGAREESTYLNATRQPAIAPTQEVKAGTIIPGVMISGLNSDLPGQIIAQVRENVYDSATGAQLLVPAGARLVGIYDSSVTLGQQRALVAWNRIIYPDGASISLAKMPGADISGYAGFNDKVNNHYWRIFGSGLLLSLFSAGIQLSQPQKNSTSALDSSQIIAGALGQQMGQIGMQMAQRNMNIQPTLEIRPGYRFNVMVTKDIILPTWQGHPMAAR